MIEIRFSPPNALELSGSPAELRDLRTRILELATSCEQSIEMTVREGVDPTPYKQSLVGLRVAKGDGPTCVAVEGDQLVISGAPHNLELFAGWLKFDDNAFEGMHAHHEYFSGNESISADSLPLVISVRRNRRIAPLPQ